MISNAAAYIRIHMFRVIHLIYWVFLYINYDNDNDNDNE